MQHYKLVVVAGRGLEIISGVLLPRLGGQLTRSENALRLGKQYGHFGVAGTRGYFARKDKWTVLDEPALIP